MRVMSQLTADNKPGFFAIANAPDPNNAVSTSSHALKLDSADPHQVCTPRPSDMEYPAR